MNQLQINFTIAVFIVFIALLLIKFQWMDALLIFCAVYLMMPPLPSRVEQ